jgi:hypothetical protein
MWSTVAAVLGVGEFTGPINDLGFGVRFPNLSIPYGAVIVSATLRLKAYASLAGAVCRARIRGEDVANAAVFSTAADYDGRARTAAYADWTVPGMTANVQYETPQFAPVIQVIINRTDWRKGNALVVFVEDNGSDAEAGRQFVGWDGDPTFSPMLIIRYYEAEPTPRMAIITVHDDFPSFPMLAEFRTAHDINRLLVQTPADKGPGTFSFAISRDDPQANRDTVRKGLVVAIRSTQAGCPPFLGRIDDVEHKDDGTVGISGPAYAQVLFERALPQDCSFSSQAAGVIAMQLLKLANAYNPTGIWPSKASEPGSPIRGDFDAGSAQLGDALNDLADKTGDEWWLEEIVSRQKIDISLRWGRKRGQDRSREITLYEGKHFTTSSYRETSQGVARSAIAIGGGEAVSDRAAAAATMGRPASASGKATVIGAASEVQMRNVAVGMTLARDVVVNLPLDTDQAVLASAAQKALEIPANAAEELALTLAPSAPWDLGLGDSFTVILPNVRFGGATRKVRLLDLQPDEAMGERDIAVSVEYD